LSYHQIVSDALKFPLVKFLVVHLDNKRVQTFALVNP
jgi:hypothetical protein